MRKGTLVQKIFYVAVNSISRLQDSDYSCIEEMDEVTRD